MNGAVEDDRSGQPASIFMLPGKLLLLLPIERELFCAITSTLSDPAALASLPLIQDVLAAQIGRRSTSARTDIGTAPIETLAPLDAAALEAVLRSHWVLAAVRATGLAGPPEGCGKITLIADLDGADLPWRVVVVPQHRAAGATAISVEQQFSMLAAPHSEGLPVPEPLYFDAYPHVVFGQFAASRDINIGANQFDGEENTPYVEQWIRLTLDNRRAAHRNMERTVPRKRSITPSDQRPSCPMGAPLHHTT